MFFSKTISPQYIEIISRNGENFQVPEFEEAAFSSPLNKVVRCKTKFGWHLLQVLSERYIWISKYNWKTKTHMRPSHASMSLIGNMSLKEVDYRFFILLFSQHTERNRYLNRFSLMSSMRKCKIHLFLKRLNWLMLENRTKCMCMIISPLTF